MNIVFNIISPLGNANQSYNEMALHTRMALIKKIITSVGKNVEKLEPS